MTEKQAYQLSLDLWIWLFKNPDKRKFDSPYWERLVELNTNCPLCKLRMQNSGFICIGNIGCTSLTMRKCFDGAFLRWFFAEFDCYSSYYSRKVSAAYIASKIRRHMRKQGWIERSK